MYELVDLVSQTGFPIGVSIFLLYKGYTQDKAFLVALTKLDSSIRDCQNRGFK